jgi:hypothetical protein
MPGLTPGLTCARNNTDCNEAVYTEAEIAAWLEYWQRRMNMMSSESWEGCAMSWYPREDGSERSHP